MGNRIKPLDQQKLLKELVKKDSYVLIILDACRYDALSTFVRDNKLGYKVQMATSGVPNTHTWVRTNWTDEYDTTYISTIPFISDHEVDGPTGGGSYHGTEHFSNVVNAWRDNWDDDEGCVPPSGVLDATFGNIDDRMIIHFCQPHMPHIGEPSMRFSEIESENLAEVGKKGEFTDEQIKLSYMANLARVWGEGVQPLLEELDEDRYESIIITADHGEALGENNRYGHNTNTPEVHLVPWVEVK